MKINRTQTTSPAESKFGLPAKPGHSVPSLPTRLEELDDIELMNLYSELMSWASYAKSELVAAEIVEERAAYDLRISESMSLIGQWSADAKGDRVTIAKARRDVEPQVIDKQNALLEAKAHRKLIDSVFDRCERSAQVLSRELSRRISLYPKERGLGRFSA